VEYAGLEGSKKPSFADRDDPIPKARSLAHPDSGDERHWHGRSGHLARRHCFCSPQGEWPGDVVVGVSRSSGGGARGFRWTQATGMQSIGNG